MPHKLLLADDSVTIQRVIELTFADEDVQVLAVGDGKQAIARVQSDRPDIVLADVGMPELDGYEVAAFIKKHPDLAHIPVLLLTGAFEPIDEARAHSVGCDGVLVKPFEPQMVINRVKDLLAGRRPQGLWAATPSGQTPQRGPEARAEVKTPAAAVSGAASGSLEDYFDRLDAAFATLDAGVVPAADRRPLDAPPAPPLDLPEMHGAAAARAPQPVDDLAGWDPDLAGDVPRPAAVDHTAVAAPPQIPVVPQLAPAAPVARPMPAAAVPLAHTAFAAPPISLAEAFAALLSAEQGHPVAPSVVRPGALSDEVIDDVVRRVTERMSERAVRETVIEVAERLVREEIARIKGV